MDVQFCNPCNSFSNFLAKIFVYVIYFLYLCAKFGAAKKILLI